MASTDVTGLLPMSNFETFSESISPLLPLRPRKHSRPTRTTQCKTSAQCRCGCRIPITECEYFLRDLWRFYDLPFGLEVPVKNLPVSHVHFVPYLSSVQIYVHVDAVNNLSHLISPPSVSPIDDAQLVLEFFETVQPEARLPFPEQIHALAASCPLLNEGKSSLLHPRSWFSVLWYPLLCDKHTIPFLKGSFLSYHGFQFQEDTNYACLCHCRSQFRSPFNNLLQLLPLNTVLSSFATPDKTKPKGNSYKNTSSPSSTGCNSRTVYGPAFKPTMDGLQEYLPPPCYLSNRLFPFGMLPHKIHNPTWFWKDQTFSPWEEALLENPSEFVSMFQIDHHDYAHIVSSSLSMPM
ncbi:hypothetical protein P9112_002544 [Eukaryota sp. TZLM1-RC]